MAITKATFINETYLQQYTPISANVDIKLIVPFIITAQDMYAQDVFGTEFYERLMAGISAGNLTVKETELLELSQPAIAWLTLHEAIPFINVGIRNKGILKGTSDTTESASFKEVGDLKDSCKNKYEFYMTRVQEWLCISTNTSTLTLYTNPTRNMHPNKGDVYTSDIYTGDSSSEKCKQNFFRTM
jgi:hypothetical protein